MIETQDAKKKVADVLDQTLKGKAAVVGKVKDISQSAQKAMIETLDVNGDGEVNIEDVIILGMRTPGIKIDREKFLKKELQKYVPIEVIEDAILHTPAKASVPKETINKIANDVIQYERNCVTGISAALGAPGGVAMAATLPADMTQYYGYMLRVTQKLLYLYGFQQVDVEETGGTFDSETMNTLILCLGVMYGVVGANNALKALAKAFAVGVNKKFMRTAVTKGILYPIVKSVCKWFGVNLTKKMCTNFFSKSIPVIGGVLGGGLTYVTFKPCCDKLKAALQDTLLSNAEHQSTPEEEALTNQIIEVDINDIVETSVEEDAV